MRGMIKIAITSLLLIAGTQLVQAQGRELFGTPAYSVEDTSMVYRIKYNGSSTACISNTATTVILVDGTVSTTLTTLGTSNTVNGLMTAMMACTNSAGAKNFQVELLCAISGDVISNNVIAGTIILNDGQWHEAVKWDTSQCLHYDACSYGDEQGRRWVSTIYGQPGGTGDLTLNVYIDGNRVYDKYITSPVYVPASITGITNLNTAVNYVNVYENLAGHTSYGLLVPPKSKCLIRATRATSATTGGIGGLISTL